ncbi:MAG: fluoride efflux transporter CrcB [Bacteroidetes bacterium]|nr:fluoride efflux transporter CrcB [Bacteroidota bacterium]
MTLLWVMLGGAIGSAHRYGIGKWLPTPTGGFPWSTFWVNASGCLLIGILAGYFEKRSVNSESLRWFWMAGICGGFTTFSAFSLETVSLLQQQCWLLAVGYVLASVGIGLLATLASWQYLRTESLLQ